jgi:hypothetical protein
MCDPINQAVTLLVRATIDRLDPFGCVTVGVGLQTELQLLAIAAVVSRAQRPLKVAKNRSPTC